MTKVTLEDMEDISITIKVGNHSITKGITEANIKTGFRYKSIGSIDDYRLHMLLDVYIDEVFTFDLGAVE